jgi:hypothetical protein
VGLGNYYENVGAVGTQHDLSIGNPLTIRATPTLVLDCNSREAAPVRNDRRRLIEKSRPFLDDGEVVAHVIRALEGLNRWVGLAIAAVIAFGLTIAVKLPPVIGALILMLVFTRLYARRVIVSTDRGIVVLAGGLWRFTPKARLDRLDLETRIGPLRGVWLETNLNGRRLFVVPRSAVEVAESDADLDVD